MTVDADNLTDDDLKQLAQSLAVDGSLGRADTLRVVDASQALATGPKGLIQRGPLAPAGGGESGRFI